MYIYFLLNYFLRTETYKNNVIWKNKNRNSTKYTHISKSNL